MFTIGKSHFIVIRHQLRKSSRKNKIQINQNYKTLDKVIIRNKSALNYETPYNIPYKID